MFNLIKLNLNDAVEVKFSSKTGSEKYPDTKSKIA